MTKQNQSIANNLMQRKTEAGIALKSLHTALPRVSAKEAALANLAYASTPTLLEGARFRWERASAKRQFTTRIRLNSDKQSYFMWLQPLANFSPIFSGATPSWPDSVNCQLFEIAFGPLIDIIAGKIGMPLRVSEVDEVTASQPDFYLDGGDGKFIHFTYRAHSNAVDAYGLLDTGNITQLFASTEVLAASAPLQKITVQWDISLGTTTLSTREFGDLEIGDVMLPERRIDPVNPAVYLLAPNHRRVAQAILQDEKLTMTDIQLGQMMENTETQKHTTETNQGSDSTQPRHDGALLDNLDIELVFEAGKINMPLAELKSLAVGSVLSLGRNPTQQPVTIRCNDAILGRAELVLVGDELGVRIVSWSKNA